MLEPFETGADLYIRALLDWVQRYGGEPFPGQPLPPRQNRALLERLSQSTNGQYWTPAQWAKMVEAISYSNAGITEQQISYLWDAPFFFLMLVLLGAGWRVRVRMGETATHVEADEQRL